MYYQHNKAVKATKTAMTHIVALAAVIVVAVSAFGLQNVSQAKGGDGAALPGDNKQIVTGTTAPCAKTTVDTGATVKATSITEPISGTTVTGFTVLDMRGTLTNCSTSLQSYYITFNEQPRNAFDTISQPTCTLTFGTGYWSVGAYIMKSGDKKGWSFSNEIISGAGITDPTNCFGTHKLDVNVVDMSTGVILQTLTASYTVTQ